MVLRCDVLWCTLPAKRGRLILGIFWDEPGSHPIGSFMFMNLRLCLGALDQFQNLAGQWIFLANDPIVSLTKEGKIAILSDLGNCGQWPPHFTNLGVTLSNLAVLCHKGIGDLALIWY